jgi:hypothetical protein
VRLVSQIRELGGYLRGMASLMEIDASKNRIMSISPAVESCRELQCLLLSGNKITALPVEMGTLTALEKLDLRHNRLSSMLPELGALKSLRQLDVSSNALDGPLPHAFGMMEGLRYANLSFNRITTFPATLGNLVRLERLNASESMTRITMPCCAKWMYREPPAVPLTAELLHSLAPDTWHPRSPHPHRPQPPDGAAGHHPELRGAALSEPVLQQPQALP